MSRFLAPRGFTPGFFIAAVFPGSGRRVYTLINRDSVDRDGRQLMLPFAGGMRYYDVYNGRELTPERLGDRVGAEPSLFAWAPPKSRWD